jgi:pyrimidine-nucleoside phosphorylase
MVPADRVLYALRDTTGTVDSVPLIASSVMSKKLAAGADAILLDVKCGRGAFVASLEEAVALARSLVAVGDAAGRQTVAYVTDMEQPLGRAVGNALEVREAIDTLAGGGPADLRSLCLRLGAEMLRLAGVVKDLQSGEDRLARAIEDGSGLRKLGDLVEAQGGDRRVCDDPARLPQAPFQRPLEAKGEGFVSSVDALAIGLAAKSLGSGRERKDQPIDPAVGVVLHKKISDPVRPGETLAVIYARSEFDAERVAERVTAAFSLGARATGRPLMLRRVGAGRVEALTDGSMT